MIKKANETVLAVSAASKFVTEFIVSSLSHPCQIFGLFLAHVAYVTFTQEDEPGQVAYTGPGGDSETFAQEKCSHGHPDHGLEWGPHESGKAHPSVCGVPAQSRALETQV